MTRQLLVGPTVTLLLAGCAAGGSETAAPPTRNVHYESASPVLTPGKLDVYAPTGWKVFLAAFPKAAAKD